MSATAPLHGPRFALWGLGGGLACDGLDPQEAQLAAGVRPGDLGYGCRPPGRRVDGAEERPQELLAGDYPAFYAGVRDWLAGAGPPPVDPSDAVAVLEILAAARRSAAAGEVVRLVTP